MRGRNESDSNRSGAIYKMSYSPCPALSIVSATVFGRKALLMQAARIPKLLIASTWSFIREIKGEITRVKPELSCAKRRAGLITKGLPGPSRHNGKGILLLEDAVDNPVLTWTEFFISVHPFQHQPGIFHINGTSLSLIINQTSINFIIKPSSFSRKRALFFKTTVSSPFG